MRAGGRAAAPVHCPQYDSESDDDDFVQFIRRGLGNS